MMPIRMCWMVALTGLVWMPDLAAAENTGSTPAVEELVELLRQQQVQIEKQRHQLESQQALLEAQSHAIKALQTQLDEMMLSGAEPRQLSEEEQAIRDRLQALETSVASLPTEQEETTTTYDETEFPGAFQVPGTDARMRFGGYVKANLVQSLDALGSQTRFIVGTIPTRGPVSGDREAALTVQQSRLNLELRENTRTGQLRAFMEGDFAGQGDTFRLRHAFGQYRTIMAGKTWSTFMDVEASPEEVDFEGINGRINVRQAQLRFFPALGKQWNLMLSLEDPQPDITDGTGLSQFADFVASIRGDVYHSWNVKASMLLRNLRARWTTDTSVKDSVFGWGLSVSGRRFVDWTNDSRDNVAVQLSYGEGYGRYVNDLGTVGGQDAVFDPQGSLKVLPVLSSYLSFQKWWKDGLRSTLTLSYVGIDNYDFQLGEAYRKTWRVSGNLIWSPIPRVNVGGELLFGERTDKDGQSGDASQFQASVRYIF